MPSTPPTSSDPLADPFDDILGLEDTYYNEGHALGLEDGRKAGMSEGRAFGMQTSFEKFQAMGRMHGRAVIWAGRLEQARLTRERKDATQENDVLEQSSKDKDTFTLLSDTRTAQNGEPRPYGSGEAGMTKITLKPLPANSRLPKHIRTLWALSEPESLDVSNNEEGVSEFDDRYKRALAKVRIVGKMVGEDIGSLAASTSSSQVPNANEEEIGGPSGGSGAIRANRGEVGIEDVDILKVRH